MTKLLKRLLFALFLLLGVIIFGLQSVWAAPPDPVEAEPDPSDCRACHLENVIAWEGSAHRRALTCSQCHDENAPAVSPTSNHPMQKADEPPCVSCHTTGYDAATNTWKEDGVGCAACHGPVNPDHPDASMPVDRSAYLCGGCHTETQTEWKLSQHGREDMSCVSCHNPHAGGLKVEDTSTLCLTCHEPGSENFVHSKHATFVLTKHNEEALTCGDCHLGILGNELGQGHAILDHSFHVRLGTCSACHDRQAHSAGEDTIAEPTATPTPIPLPIEANILSLTPSPVSPLGFIGLALLAGLGAGMVVGPWLQHVGKRFNAVVDKAEEAIHNQEKE